MEITAKLNNLRVAPRKVRLVADLIRGKKVAEAKLQLQFLTKGVAEGMAKLLTSAESNAQKNFKIESPENLYVAKIFVDEGRKFKRYMPRSRGTSYMIRKRTSHTTLVLSDKKPSANKK